MVCDHWWLCPFLHNNFYGFVDAAFANQNDFKSTSEYIFMASGEAIMWRSKKQTMVALSSTEAKYIALTETACEASWFRNLYDKLGYPQLGPPHIKGDNNGSIAMARNPQFHQQFKLLSVGTSFGT